ncbi:hypothetical protein DER44DRAFT_817962 [Fusarium oxysporum]|nr:hypothetical protein DER44DRAFT_817962 [Fusarium oxysporum]
MIFSSSSSSFYYLWFEVGSCPTLPKGNEVLGHRQNTANRYHYLLFFSNLEPLTNHSAKVFDPHFPSPTTHAIEQLPQDSKVHSVQEAYVPQKSGLTRQASDTCPDSQVLLSEVKKIDNARKRAVLQRAEESDKEARDGIRSPIDSDSDTPYESSNSESKAELSVSDYIISGKVHSKGRATDTQINMPGQQQRHGTTAILRTDDWSLEDALHALDAEFYCRNEANNPENFEPGVSTILRGEPGYDLWVELRAKIRDYFSVAAANPDLKGMKHPMTTQTMRKAFAAVRAFYGNRYVDVDGGRVHWDQSLPDRADWIVDRFCSPFHGWNPVLSHAASVLGLAK